MIGTNGGAHQIKKAASFSLSVPDLGGVQVL
jgi:hypothetical protein